MPLYANTYPLSSNFYLSHEKKIQEKCKKPLTFIFLCGRLSQKLLRSVPALSASTVAGVATRLYDIADRAATKRKGRRNVLRSTQ